VPPDWEEQLLTAIQTGPRGPKAADSQGVETRTVGRYELSQARFGEVTVLATSAPLLPVQLARVCDLGTGALTIAFATGNRLARPDRGEPQTVPAVSEARLEEILGAARRLVS
jgi:L-aminopeptidase/D-esterase-like protein